MTKYMSRDIYIFNDKYIIPIFIYNSNVILYSSILCELDRILNYIMYSFLCMSFSITFICKCTAITVIKDFLTSEYETYNLNIYLLNSQYHQFSTFHVSIRVK